MHLFLLNTYQKKQNGLLTESQSNQTTLTQIRHLYDDFFLKDWCVLFQKKDL